VPEEKDTQQPPAGDVEAHATRGRGRNDAGPPPEAIEREQAAPDADADDDVEGHAARGRY